MPKRGRGRTANKRGAKRRPTRGNRYSLTVQRRGSIISFLPLMRTILTCIPMDSALKKTFDVVFNLISRAINQTNNYVGAYAMFGVQAGALLINSPLLAPDSNGKYTFPGYPVRVKYINFILRDTTQAQERSGRWAAVFVPYREEHDSGHYANKLASLTYQELAAMPYAVSGTCLKPLRLSFRMRDPSDYCSRPRELAEELGVVMIIWDTGSRDDFTKKMDNTSFNCEIDVTGGCVPHVIFGPTHRVSYPADTFKIRSLTSGATRIHHEDGRIEFRHESDDYVMLG